MKIISLLLCCILIFGASNAEKPVDKPLPNIDTKITTESNPPKTTIPSTTNSPTTTTQKTTTTSSTTQATTTSTTDSPSTTTPAPVPENHKWFVNGTNQTCIIVEMKVVLNIEVKNTTNNVTVPTEILIPINRTSAMTDCSNNEEFMKLTWKSAGTKNNSISMFFIRNEKNYALEKFEVEIASQDIPNYNKSETIKLKYLQPHYNTSFGCSYRVSKDQVFNLTNANDKETSGSLNVMNLQFQAFRTEKTATFAEVCDFETPDIVPIAVGCVLAGLVVIVLVAYLISRRRSQARGYLSM